jgi:hypothetical protein
VIIGALAGLLLVSVLLFAAVMAANSRGDLNQWGKIVGVMSLVGFLVSGGSLIGALF